MQEFSKFVGLVYKDAIAASVIDADHGAVTLWATSSQNSGQFKS